MYLSVGKIILSVLFVLTTLLMIVSGCSNSSDPNEEDPFVSDSSFFVISYSLNVYASNSDISRPDWAMVSVGRYSDFEEGSPDEHPDELLTDVTVRFGDETLNKTLETTHTAYVFTLSESMYGDSLELSVTIDEDRVITEKIFIPEPYEVTGITENRTVEVNQILDLSCTAINYYDKYNIILRGIGESTNLDTMVQHDTNVETNLIWTVPDIGLDSLSILYRTQKTNDLYWILPQWNEHHISYWINGEGEYFLDVE